MIASAVATARNTALIAWFDDNARDLPWRAASDPYPILVSEVMLQQTQVNRVIPKYEAFLQSWPTTKTLTSAATADLLRSWAGLGYNNRALRLRDTARIVDDVGWPTSVTELQQLPGIGPYTAAALGSIAFGWEAPAIDTNLKRVLGRWAGESLSGKSLEAFAFEAIGSPPGDWNQALMDLGSALCRPSDPLCGECPVAQWCDDPSVYSAPPAQKAFSGSNRQLRGLLVRAHLAGENPTETAESSHWSSETVQAALDDLRSEGLIEY